LVVKRIKDNVLSWCDDLEASALSQALNISGLDVLAGDFCLMPDAHAGVGMPIGGVAALKGAVSPNMVKG
jgi:tRNA-splicing ligase RtcB